MERAPQANSNLVITLYFIMKMLPMLISGMCIYLGYKLFILGVTGQASLSVESDTISGQLLNAAPGLFFAIGGVVALIFSIVKGVKINFNNGNGIGMDINNSNFPF
jgi:hypothetical protein